MDRKFKDHTSNVPPWGDQFQRRGGRSQEALIERKGKHQGGGGGLDGRVPKKSPEEKERGGEDSALPSYRVAPVLYFRKADVICKPWGAA